MKSNARLLFPAGGILRVGYSVQPRTKEVKR